MATPEISVIIPTRDRAPLVVRAIESVLVQTQENFELIVVDDQSTDDTLDRLAEIQDGRFRWVRLGEWRGANFARNYGVSLARAGLIAFLDSDDRYLPHRLLSDLAFFSGASDHGLRISSFLLEMSNSAVRARVNEDASLSPRQLEERLVAHLFHLAGSSITVRRRVFEAANGFDETVLRMQDRDFLLRVARTNGATLDAEVNWVKSVSPDSVSAQTGGAMLALGGLYARHPVIRDRYGEIFHYLLAREIVAALLNGRPRSAWSMIRELAAMPEMDPSPIRLAIGYLRGKRRRHALRKSSEQTLYL